MLIAVDERSAAPLVHDDDVTPLLRVAASLRGTHVAVVSDRTSQEVMVDTRLTGVVHLLGFDVWSAVGDPEAGDPEASVVSLAADLDVDVVVMVAVRRHPDGVEVGVVRTFVGGAWTNVEPVCRCDGERPADVEVSCLARVVESIVGACAVRRSR